MRTYLKEGFSKDEISEMADQKAIEAVIASIAGDEKNIYENFKNLALSDAVEINVKVKEILDPKV